MSMSIGRTTALGLPLLFVIFINDIDDCAENIDILLKFADDTKLEHNASTVVECEKNSGISKLYDFHLIFFEIIL